MFHGLISETEMRELLCRADKQLRQSLTTEENKRWTKHRVSQSAWMNDSEDQMLTKINQRIKLVTGLNTAPSKENSLVNQYEVVNYGVGGMHIDHMDALDSSVSGLTDDNPNGSKLLLTQKGSRKPKDSHDNVPHI
ncbi:prolyl 4-hydroxylase subunit alpha-3-like [Mizuhopecten yessoensis]|uniref:prolyl 4-hydroxylase subunit alpha-3-like n=1 Tax=Mizuhopecten yessoensis TaxID=6573 RepID=UPI000B45DB63|nr:prolyl 4-hydroxylase subunit alpha-3-like [Mizuhopecten yessoensis]